MGNFYTTIPEPGRQAEVETIEVLLDKSSTGRERPWRDKKMANESLALAYESVDSGKAARLKLCGDFLTFSILEDGSKKLKHMNSCRVRLCPLCTWRRSLKVFSNTLAILKAMNGKYEFIMLTLTQKNCVGPELSASIDDMMSAWQRYTQRQRFRKAVKGWYRGLEVTHNTDIGDISYDTYHPHFHVILVVNKSYFTGRAYIRLDEWKELWMECMRLDYLPNIKVEKIRSYEKNSNGEVSVEDIVKAVAETCKYTVEDEDYIVPTDWALTVDAVRILDKALADRRLIAYGGIMKELHKQLNLDDEETGDLINVDSEDSAAAPTDRVESYFWNTGYRQYIRKI